MSIKLKKVEKLPKSKRVFRSKYDEIIEQFLDDGSMTYAEVSKEGVKTSSLLTSLKSRISKKYEGKLTVVQRDSKVYLSKDIDAGRYASGKAKEEAEVSTEII